MTPTAPYALVVLGLSVLLWPPSPNGGRLRPPSTGRGGWRARIGLDDDDPAARQRADLIAGIGPALVIVLIAPEAWWLVVLAAAVVVIRRRAARRSRGSSSRRQADLAVHHELVAACLDAGMPIGAALRAVADALPSTPPRADGTAAPAGGAATAEAQADRVLEAVVAMLELGAGPDAAWKPADDDPDLRPLAAAARRSALGGTGLADAVREQAQALRAQVETAERQATGRAGVLMVAPLGVCFLPAFLCLGLAPVVLGLIGRLDLF